MIDSTSTLGLLQKATEGLLFPSETDAPLVPFFWPLEGEDNAPLSPELVLKLAGAKPDAIVKSTTLAAFFKPAIKEETWHNDEERAEVVRFKALVEAIKSTLQKPQVWKIGAKEQADIYIVGGVEGGHAGLKTQVVET